VAAKMCWRLLASTYQHQAASPHQRHVSGENISMKKHNMAADINSAASPVHLCINSSSLISASSN